MKRLGKRYLRIGACLAFSCAVSALFAGDLEQGRTGRPAPPTRHENDPSTGKVAPAVYRGAGTVTRVNRDLGVVMIAHDPVPELNWPAMNMTFGVRNDALLDSIEQGERINFLFDKSGEEYVIFSIER